MNGVSVQFGWIYPRYYRKNHKQKNLLLCASLVGVWILEYLYPYPIIVCKANLGVEFDNGRETLVVKDPVANHL